MDERQLVCYPLVSNSVCGFPKPVLDYEISGTNPPGHQPNLRDKLPVKTRAKVPDNCFTTYEPTVILPKARVVKLLLNTTTLCATTWSSSATHWQCGYF